MNDFLNFIFESGISMGLFTVLYLMFLQKETFFRTNRFFLLFALLFSFVLPLLHFSIFNSNQASFDGIAGQQYSIMLESVSVYGASVSQSFIQSITASNLLIAIYVLGMAFFAIRFSIRLIQISLIIRRNKIVHENHVRLVVLEKEVSPFSFLSYVFAGANNKNLSGWDKMLIHEMEHVKQRHTIDILILEVISVVQWFNPFFWLLKRMLKENHEYLADRAVLKQDNNTTAYRQVLLSQLIGVHLNMTNNFNYSIKKRMMMMTKIKSSKLANMKVLVGILLAVALVFVFACDNKDIVESGDETSELKSTEISSPIGIGMEEIVAVARGEAADGYNQTDLNTTTIPNISKPLISEEDSTIFVIPEEMPEYPGGDEALMMYLAKNIKYPALAQDAGIQGRVYVTFIVEEDGSVGRAKIARGVDESLDNEALRVVSEMPVWKPGKKDGLAVAVQYTVPISFVLQ